MQSLPICALNRACEINLMKYCDNGRVFGRVLQGVRGVEARGV